MTMTLLHVMPDDNATTALLHTRKASEIADALSEQSVTFRRWQLRGSVTTATSSDELLERYREDVDALCTEHDLKLVDVARIHRQVGADAEERAVKARAMFLEEHQHSEDEVRFFAHGSGCFYLHLEGRVFAVVCEAGDLLSVPASTRHWFDMGSDPEFAAIRFFQKEDGWVGDFTGVSIASNFPSLDALVLID
jgi:1,2-dihydroxy-3-keto-5-methylthiopentene dioxygenase